MAPYRSRRSGVNKLGANKQVWNWIVTIGSVFFCLLILPIRLPGMDIVGVGPNWLLIWIVAWSMGRLPWEGAMVGIILGLLQDSLTAPFPSHMVGLAIAGFLTARLYQQRILQEDLISVALVVFGLAILSETAMALQLTSQYWSAEESLYAGLGAIWGFHQRVALSSAILTSLWAPALYYPLKRWWDRYRISEKK
ncbi:MAG: rod shape-determining protein MreD [Cyanobacteria bacterium J06621_11]